jgi:HEPN domain-containing protein
LDVEGKIKYWLEMSEYDLETAEAMLQTGRFLYVGFMCHQVIEKILKAYFVFISQENAPNTHNLTLLSKQSQIYNEMNDDQLDFLDILGPLNIEARYPTHKEKIMKSLDKERCTDILQKTRGLRKWIKDRLSI